MSHYKWTGEKNPHNFLDAIKNLSFLKTCKLFLEIEIISMCFYDVKYEISACRGTICSRKTAKTLAWLIFCLDSLQIGLTQEHYTWSRKLKLMEEIFNTKPMQRILKMCLTSSNDPSSYPPQVSNNILFLHISPLPSYSEEAKTVRSSYAFLL